MRKPRRRCARKWSTRGWGQGAAGSTGAAVHTPARAISHSEPRPWGAAPAHARAARAVGLPAHARLLWHARRFGPKVKACLEALMDLDATLRNVKEHKRKVSGAV